MSNHTLADIKILEYWTVRQASSILNIPEKTIRQALADHTLRRYFFRSSTQKINADEAREWAHSAPAHENGQWL
jgi:excisionase family DNA binding protein